jgi:hypothetical protein
VARSNIALNHADRPKLAEAACPLWSKYGASPTLLFRWLSILNETFRHDGLREPRMAPERHQPAARRIRQLRLQIWFSGADADAQNVTAMMWGRLVG